MADALTLLATFVKPSELVFGTSALAQLVQVFLLAVIVYSLMIVCKGVTETVRTYSQATTMLLPDLYDGPQVLFQDPTQAGSKTIYPSVNAPTGLEFSYSCFLLINKSSFQGGSDGLRHIFHKGSPSYKPLMCPGVFVRNNTNTLVVFMNETGAWNSRCEVPNIPVGKFFHLAIVVRNMAVDVYINGNIAIRKSLSSVPKQNFGDLYVFKSETFSDANPDHPFTVVGPATGLISTLAYSGYALNYEQIDRQMRNGPSTKLVSATQNLPPYLADNWWVTYHQD